MVCKLVMKKIIIITLVILSVVTAVAAAAFTVIADSREVNNGKSDIRINDEEVLPNFDENDTGEEVDITYSDDEKIDSNHTEKIEINRTRYEDCGYGTAYYVIEYSDGTSEIVDE